MTTEPRIEDCGCVNCTCADIITSRSSALSSAAEYMRQLEEVKAVLAMIRDDFDRAIAAHDPSDPRHRSHGGQHTNGRCCEFGNLNPGAIVHMRRLMDAISTLTTEKAK